MDIFPEISILHFNDVYNVEARKKDPCGGIERFVTVLDKYKDKDPLVIFSGDIFSPSSLSITFKGEHMIPFLKRAGVTVASVGNHDLDFGCQQFEKLSN
jgi:5'-nucleotidase